MLQAMSYGLELPLSLEVKIEKHLYFQDVSVASGVYFYTLTADDFTATRKMLIMK